MTEERFRFRKDTEQPGSQQADSYDERPEEGEERPRTRVEEFTVSGDRLVSKVTKILREGNALRVTIKDQSGNVLFEIPMSVSVVGTLFFPSITALVFIGSVVANLKIVVERKV
jgi:hypothetical protein